MAYGEIKVSGDDVLEALTRLPYTTYVRELNADGETLADLIAERVLKTILSRLDPTSEVQP